MHFESPETLSNWLRDVGCPLEQWGHGDAKGVENLWRELRAGECQIQAEPPLRIVAVIAVWVNRGDRCLFEVAQTWEDGRIRQRHGPPSDKMHLDEPLREAALRCLWEELGVADEAVTFLDLPITTKQSERLSASYPGLLSRYTGYNIYVTVPSLPNYPFRTAEQLPAASDPVRFHDWEWLPCESSDW